ncbi:MAG TPA: alpha/beta fold hydrolase, partial [Thermomicrobiales bacterium]|nr:alpha/beta fold hydrolase [Thermomicrobiales bacterium]
MAGRRAAGPPGWRAEPGRAARRGAKRCPAPCPTRRLDGSPAARESVAGLGNGDSFVNQIPAFEKDYQVIAMDSRGHGRSSFDDKPISYELMASDVLGLLDHLNIDKTDLVGWSDGGIIGLELAIHHPERLNKVVA